MRFKFMLALIVLSFAMVGAASAQNSRLTLHPSGFGQHARASWKAQEGLPDSSGNANQALYLQKFVPTATFSAAVALIEGLEGQPASALTGLSWEHRNDGHCGAGAPRWNVGITDGANNYTVFLGCAAAAHSPGSAPGWTRDSYPGPAIGAAITAVGANPATATIRYLAIVFDEGTDQGPGYVYLDNITVNDKVWTSAKDNGNGGSANASTPFVLFGDTTVVKSGQGANKFAYDLISTATTFSGIDYTPPSSLTFAGLKQLSADYKLVQGCLGGGSPRFQINVDTDGDGSPDGNVFVYIGTAPNFDDCTTGWQSTGNLLSSPDARFDLSQFGGPFYGTYADALALLGSNTVTGVQLVVDAGWKFGTQEVLVDNVTVNNHKLTANRK